MAIKIGVGLVEVGVYLSKFIYWNRCVVRYKIVSQM